MAFPGFYWLVEGSLAGSPRPGGDSGWPSPMSPQDEWTTEQRLDNDCRSLVELGIGAVLTLTERPLAATPLARHGLVAYHLPIPDQTAPHPSDFIKALDFIEQQHSLNRAALVHCRFGAGRTGTILAAWLIRRGASAEQAIARVREIRTGAVTTPEQEAALYRFAARREWIV